jgi:hypothetical protein
MIGTINPAVCGGQRASFSYVSAIHVLAASAAGAVSGLFLGGVGSVLFGARAPLPRVTAIVLGMACFAYAGFHAGLYRLPLPSLRRQVRHGWRFAPAPWAALFYGLGLGSGLHVHIRFGALYVLVLAALLSASPSTGGVILGLYGLCRALPVPIFGWLHRTPERIAATFEWLSDERNFSLRRLRSWALLGAGVWLVCFAVIRS